MATTLVGTIVDGKANFMAVAWLSRDNLKRPMISVSMECGLIQTVDLPTHGIFIGEIVAAYCEERFPTGGEPDVQNIKPLLLTMEDRRYWAFGEQVSKA
jgi:hypothetical protein